MGENMAANGLDGMGFRAVKLQNKLCLSLEFVQTTRCLEFFEGPWRLLLTKHPRGPAQLDKHPVFSRVSLQLHALRGNKTLKLAHVPVMCRKCSQSCALTSMCLACGDKHVEVQEPASWKKVFGETIHLSIEKAVCRGLETSLKLCKETKRKEFREHGGDFLFLFRYLVVHTPKDSSVHNLAHKVLFDVFDMWDNAFPSLKKSATTSDLFLFAEAVSAKSDFKEFLEDMGSLCDQLSTSLRLKKMEEVFEFDPRKCAQVPLLPNGRCPDCYKDHKPDTQVCEKCRKPIQSTIDYRSICLAVVWCGLFEDIGLVFETADSKCEVIDILSRLHLIRPYKQLSELGLCSFKDQCYFVTHLIYVLSDWGTYRLPRDLLIEEFIFLQSAVETSIKLGDPEIAGEVVQCLRILGCDERDYAIKRGVLYLLNKEKSLKHKGKWLKTTEFFSNYHAIFCACVGLLSTTLDECKLPKKWRSALTSRGD